MNGKYFYLLSFQKVSIYSMATSTAETCNNKLIIPPPKDHGSNFAHRTNEGWIQTSVSLNDSANQPLGWRFNALWSPWRDEASLPIIRTVNFLHLLELIGASVESFTCHKAVNIDEGDSFGEDIFIACIVKNSLDLKIQIFNSVQVSIYWGKLILLRMIF